MKKIDLVEYDRNYFFENKLFSTKYDNLFRDVVKARGIGYYNAHKVTNFHKRKNKIFAIVEGTTNYHVSVEYIDDKSIKVECECPYHKDTDIYCKHVYALILTLKMIYEKEKMINIYNINYKKIDDIRNEIKMLAIDNKQYLSSLIYSWAFQVVTSYEKNLNELNDRFDKDKDYRLISLIRDSYYHLNNIIEHYNKIIDYIEEGKKEKEHIKNKKNKVIEHEYIIGDGLEETLDNFIASMPLEILEKIKNDDEKNGESTEIIDKAISKRKKIL